MDSQKTRQSKSGNDHSFRWNHRPLRLCNPRGFVAFYNIERKIKNFTAINSDLKELKGKIEFGSATLITCNPPYKIPEGSLASEKESIRIARQEITCTLEDAVSAASRLLRFGGKLYMVHQSQRIMDIITYMRQYSLEPKRIQLVQPRAGKGANLVLIEAMRGGRSGLVWEPTLVLANEDGSYTKEFKEIYHIV